MRIGILFFSDAYFLEDANKVMGRFVANDQFLSALYHAGHKLLLYVSTEIEQKYLLDKMSVKYPEISVVTISQIYLEPSLFVPDVLHILSPNLYRCFYLRNKIFKKNIPVTGVTHSLGHSVYLEWVLLNHIHGFRSHDALVCTSPTGRAVVENFQNKIIESLGLDRKIKTKIIPLGISPQQYSAHQRLAYRQNLNIAANRFVILWIGRFSYATKADLVSAFALMKPFLDKHPDVLFVCAGSQESQFELKHLNQAITDLSIQNSVQLMPDVSDEQNHDLLGVADCFFAPSDNVQETFGLSVLEAMDAALPILAYDWDGYSSILDDSCAILVPTYAATDEHFMEKLAPLQLDSQNHFWMSQSVCVDAKGLRVAMESVYSDPNLRMRLSRAAKSKSESFHWNNVIKSYELLWQDLLKLAPLESNLISGPVINYRDDFAPYSRHMLSAGTIVMASVLSQQLLAGDIGIPLYPELESWLNSGLIKGLLLEAKDPIAIQNLKERFDDDLCLLSIHLIWLLKNGFLEIQ